MDTILFSIILSFSIIAWFISLNVYFTHDDIKRGRSTHEINVETLYKTLLPLEIGLHGTIILFCAISEHYYLLLFNVPLFAYNLKILFMNDFVYENI